MNTKLALTLAALGCLTPAHGALLFYENFNSYTAGGADIAGQGGWNSTGTGTGGGIQSGTYDGWNGTMTAVPTSGGNFYVGDTAGFASSALTLSSTVTNSFASGSSTWFSFVAYQGTNGANARWSVTVGADAADVATNGNEMNGQGLGAGQLDQSTGSEFQYWMPTGDETVSDRTTSNFFAGGRPVFTILKIDWAANGSNDTITMFRWDQNFASTPTLTNWNDATKLIVNVDLDQSTFDTLGITGNTWGYVDEIRIATDFDSAVTGTEVIPEPSTAFLGGLGVLALLRRRRR